MRRRELGLGDAVLIGLGAMLGAGVFAAFAPAAASAGSGLLVALVFAGVVAYCNATSSAALAAVHSWRSCRPRSPNRRRTPRSDPVGVARTRTCRPPGDAAMASTAGAYAWPPHPRLAAVAAATVLTLVNYRGVAKTAVMTRVLVAVTLAALALVLVGSFTGGATNPARLSPLTGHSLYGVLQAAGLLFFAFAGYARIATLGEEVRDPERRAIAGRRAAGSWLALAPFVRVGAVAASLGVLLSAMAGVGRTTLAMAATGSCRPGWLRCTHDSPSRTAPSCCSDWSSWPWSA